MTHRPGYYRDRHAERRAWAIDLLGGKCNHCGTTEALTFHHRDPATKVVALTHVLARWSLARLETELVKCDLLCKPCHDGHHFPIPPHGDRTRYNHHGCRCTLCREANTAYYRDLRRRRKV